MTPRDLAVHRCGQGDPVVLLHGFFSDHRFWDSILPALSQDFRCVAVDLPGHGASGSWRGNWSDLLVELNQLLHTLAKPCHIIGYSMGARILAQLLVQSGPPIETATLISPTPGFLPAAARQRRLRDDQLAAQIQNQPLGQSIEFWSQQPIFAGQKNSPAGALNRQYVIRSSQVPRHLAFALRALGSGTRAVTKPPVRGASIRLLCGKRLSLDIQRARSLAQRWPRAQTHWLDQNGHNPVLENPTGLSALFRRILAKK